MRKGNLATGIVSQTLVLKLVQLGHSVTIGTHDASKLNEPNGRGSRARTLADWQAETGPAAKVGTFRDIAAYGELIISALSGAASLDIACVSER